MRPGSFLSGRWIRKFIIVMRGLWIFSWRKNQRQFLNHGTNFEKKVIFNPPFEFAELLHPTELSSSMESLTSYDVSICSPAPTHHSQRTKRMRTSFKHHQLRTMKSYFAVNQNPDAKDLKQLAQKTGLSKRVLQVGPLNK